MLFKRTRYGERGRDTTKYCAKLEIKFRRKKMIKKLV